MRKIELLGSDKLDFLIHAFHNNLKEPQVFVSCCFLFPIKLMRSSFLLLSFVPLIISFKGHLCDIKMPMKQKNQTQTLPFPEENSDFKLERSLDNK